MSLDPGWRRLFLAPALAALVAALAAPADGATIAVTSTADDLVANGNCTMREAVQAATTNLAVDVCAAGSASETDLVQLVAGNHELTLGEISILVDGGPVVVRGAAGLPGSAVLGTVANPGRLLRLFGARVTLESLALAFGVHPDSGGAISAISSDLSARDVSFSANSAPSGGALYFYSTSAQTLLLESCRFGDNQASSGDGEGHGGGAFVSLGGGSSGRIVDSVFRDNGAASVGDLFGVYGGGLEGSAAGGSRLEIVRSSFVANRLDLSPSGSAAGTGAYLVAVGSDSELLVVDSDFLENDVTSPSASAYTGALHVFGSSGAALKLDRLRIVNNDSGEGGRHLVLMVLGDATLEASNLLVANGPDVGIGLDCGDGDCRIDHATVYGHAERALRIVAQGSGEMRLDNSILWQTEAVAIQGTALIGPSNLTGTVDPGFVDPQNGDWSLGPTSPAIDFGESTLAGVGPLDAGHAPRVAGAETDAGAFERGGLFGDDFETADCGAWSVAVP
jgi:CSLREA domain-containing protein